MAGGSAVAGKSHIKIETERCKKKSTSPNAFGLFFFAKMAVNLGLNCKIFYMGVLHNVFSEFNGVHKKNLICLWGTAPRKDFHHEKK